MHWTTAKLIKLDKVERYLTHAWSEYQRVEFGNLVRALRTEIPPHLVAAYDQLKHEYKEPVVGTFLEKCDGVIRIYPRPGLRDCARSMKPVNANSADASIILPAAMISPPLTGHTTRREVIQYHEGQESIRADSTAGFGAGPNGNTAPVPCAGDGIHWGVGWGLWRGRAPDWRLHPCRTQRGQCDCIREQCSGRIPINQHGRTSPFARDCDQLAADLL